MKKILYALILIALYVVLIATCPAQTQQNRTDKISKHPGCNAWYWVDPKTETPEQKSAQAEAT